MPKLGVKGTYFRFDPGASQGDIGGPGGLSGALRLSTSEEAGAVGAITGSRGGPWESFAGVVSPPLSTHLLQRGESLGLLEAPSAPAPLLTLPP